LADAACGVQKFVGRKCAGEQFKVGVRAGDLKSWRGCIRSRADALTATPLQHQ